MSRDAWNVTEPGNRAVASMTNDELIIRLLFTTNHLSRWLTPIHEDVRLRRSPSRSQPSVKELLIGMRDHEIEVFPRLYAIANYDRPDLDKLPRYVRTPEERHWDQEAATLSIMSEFRRLRQSTASLLRSLPNDAWRRDGISRERGDTTIRRLAEDLARHDTELLAQMNHALDASGARRGIADVSKADLAELMKLPV